MDKTTTVRPFNANLINDCTNHLFFQLAEFNQLAVPEPAEQNLVYNAPYETPLTDIVTHAYIRGYN